MELGIYLGNGEWLMLEHGYEIENRLDGMKDFYLKVNHIIDQLPDGVPGINKKKIKNLILGDKDLKNLMVSIDAKRPPRLFVMGRTGVGKSSLINAICGSYMAAVSDIKSCTEHTKVYKYMDGQRPLMEILDTRGIAETDSMKKQSAEEELKQQVSKFTPDVALMVFNCTRRDDLNTDIDFLKDIAKSYKETNHVDLPIVIVINKCDEMSPSRHKDPLHYPQSKIEKIDEMLITYQTLCKEHQLKVVDIVGVSSLIDWSYNDEEVTVEDLASFTPTQLSSLSIVFDGRYHMKQLLDAIEEAIVDNEAKMGFKMAARLQDVILKIATHLNNVFSGLAATVAITPIPISDIYILLVIQSALVSLVASLSGRDLSIDTAKEFVLSLGGIGLAGYSFRLIAQQGAKLLNALYLGAGSAVSSAVAFGGTYAIGQAAISYYIEGKDMKDAKKQFMKVRKTLKKKKST